MSFYPQSGREQAGRRPGLVILRRKYNPRVGLASVSPITYKDKSYSLEVAIPEGLENSGVILIDHIKS
ncbi:type II toxin-antitoxin system PemK/MazF family toxin [Okeania sp. SIO2C9]|uniref:type II toxin-antitoxin system PemK/MazF family toxin n=1 Tax=Okeania sp. SIO2C9 TaxID=2607791 RepID=UPI00345D9F9D